MGRAVEDAQEKVGGGWGKTYPSGLPARHRHPAELASWSTRPVPLDGELASYEHTFCFFLTGTTGGGL